MVTTSYTIAEVDLNLPEVIKQVNNLLGNVFGGTSEAILLNKITLNTKTDSKLKSFYLAAIENNEIIGFLGFIAHDFFLNGQIISCYQACWGATSEQHRGKKIFPNLFNTAKEIQYEKGAGFLFGFPSQNSYPIMINKLGFKETTFTKINILNIPFFEKIYLNRRDLDKAELEKNAILQNDEQLIKLKEQEFGDDVKIIALNNTRIWGKVISSKKFGMNLKFFSVGGIELENSLDLGDVIKKVFSTFNGLVYIQFTFSINHSYLPLFKFLKPAQTNNLLIYDLNFNTAKENLKFNLMSGVKDVF